jgi:hypothetical protein
MEILVGSNSPITHKVFWQGQLTDADGVVGVTVYDITEDPTISPLINPGVLQTHLIAVKSEVDAGTYMVYLPYEYTNRQKDLKFIWSYQVNGQQNYREHKVYVQTPYTDLSQAVDALGLGSDYSDPNSKSYFELASAERYARKLIEDYTGQNFYLRDDVQIVYGSGSDVLPLPYKLSQLHTLHQNDILLLDNLNNVDNWNYDTMISESGFGIRINRANMLDNTVYTANGMVPPTISDTWGGAFSRGSTYRVQGRFGWPEVPDEVDIACVQLMGHYFDKDRYWKDQYLKSVQTFDWKFEYSSDVNRGTGCAYADKLLSSYVLNQMVVI